MSQVGAQTGLKKAVFFDLYGTLIDIKTDEYDPQVYSVLSHYLTYHSVAVYPDELKKVYFDGIRQYLTQSAESYPEVDIYKVFDDFMHKYGHRRYSQQTILDTILLFRSLTIRQFGVFPGVYDVLVNLGKRYKIGIISDAQWSFSEAEILKLGLDRFFKNRVLSSRHGFKKPDPRLFSIAMERLKVRPEESVYVGDNPPKDLVGAKNAGMKCILFRSDCKSFEGFQPDACFNDYSELEGILKKSDMARQKTVIAFP